MVDPDDNKAPVDRLRQSTQDLLRDSGCIEGPQLLTELEGFSGNTGTAKQLLVRLCHYPWVKVETVEGTQVFVWQDE